MKARLIVITFLIIVVSLILIWLYSIITLSAKIDEESNNMSVNVGKQVIINKDTLIVVNYNTIMETYELSNGVSVSKFLVENQAK